MRTDNPKINRQGSPDVINILNKEDFETTMDGKQTGLYILKNGKGMQASITNYGGRIVSLLVPAKNDRLVDVVVGFNNIHEYQIATEPYYGAIIGRYGNRIAKGKFILDGKEYSLLKNNGPNTLHGGKRGFQYVIWDAKQIGDNILELTYLSGDMEEGFPGNLDVKVTYSVTDHNELKIDYHATTDKKTVLNLSNHAFFNLNSIGSAIDKHLLMINADYYTPVDSTLIPIGKIDPVLNTPFDFRKPKVIGKGVDADNVQIKNGKGYDHNFVLNGTGLKTAAIATGDKTGIVLEVLTEEPAVQFYSGNFMQSKNIVRGGARDDFRTAFCLETQHFPDSPNQPSFPNTVLEPGEIYETSTLNRFSTLK
jgi:aldose 1-epimerase